MANQANIKTIDYKGFDSASDGTGPSGWMLWSGSQELSGSLYNGVGMELVAGSDSYLKFDASAAGAELDIRAKKFFVGTANTQYISGSDGNIEISSSLFHLDPLNNSLIIGAGTVINADLSANQLFVPAGKDANNATAYISSSGDAKFVGDGAGTYAVNLSPGNSSISGWSINATSLSSSNLVIDSSGEIKTKDYISNQTGWKIDGTEAEFANVKVRGTLGTTVFEKDTISAVGGQVMIANATTFTGSNLDFDGTGNPTHSFTVANTGGWVVGEYVRAKATSSTGFVEEIMQIDTISADPISLDMVRRIGGGPYIPSVTDGQVLISAGLYDNTTNPGQVTQSGYIHLNADPGDNSTPYIDIIERTGSGVNDVEVKARLGDLSGIGSLTDPGYGLYSENVFLTGKITATSGRIGGVDIESDKLYIGDGTHSDADTAFYVDNTGNFSLADKFSWNGTQLVVKGAITIEAFTDTNDVMGITANATTAANATSTLTSTVGANATTAANATSTLTSTVGANATTAANAAAAAQAVADSNAELIPNTSAGLIDFSPTPSGKGLFLGANNLGYYSGSGWDTYMSSSGDFYLGGTNTSAGLSWNASTNMLSLAGESNGFNTIFYEDFSTYAAMSDMTSSVNNPKTDGSGEGWYIPTGETAPRTFKTDEGHIKGSRSLKLGDGTTTNTRTWMISNQLIPLNPASLYEIEIRLKATKIGSTARAYVGINGYALDGSTYVNINGSNGTYSQHYVALSAEDIGNTDWTIYKGYFKGRSSSDNGASAPTITNPTTLHNNVEYISPLIITNYKTGSVSTTNIDYIRISEFQSGGGSTRISGDNISSGKVKSNNWTTTTGTEMDLNGEKITFGGSNVGTSTQGLIIDGQNSNLKFYGTTTSPILTIDDNVDGTNPGIKIEDGVLQINRTAALGTNDAVAYIKQSNSGGSTSQDLGLYVGVSEGTLDSTWSTYDVVASANSLSSRCNAGGVCYAGGTKIGAIFKAEATTYTGTLGQNNAIAIIADASAYSGYSYSFFGKGKLYNDGGDEGGMFITSSAGNYTAHLKHSSTTDARVLKLETDNTTSTGRFISYHGPNGESGYARPDGNGIKVYESSDVRLKKSIIDTNKTLADLLAINVRDFEWKSDGKKETGFIAQELNKVLPELVDTSNPDRWFINRDGLIPILVKSVQDQQLEIANMKQQILELTEMFNGINKQ